MFAPSRQLHDSGTSTISRTTGESDRLPEVDDIA
jgi:hypothetical protein